MAGAAVLDAPRLLLPAPRSPLDGPAATRTDWDAHALAAERYLRSRPDWQLAAGDACARLVPPQDWPALADAAVAAVPRSLRRRRLRRARRSATRVAVATWVVVSSTAVLGLAVLPHTGAYSTLTVLSASMAPTIPAGSVVVGVPVPVEQLRVGDVITYVAPVDGNPVVTHRVTGLQRVPQGWALSTTGDANPAADPWRALLRPRDEVLQHRLTLPRVGSALRELRRPEVQAALRYALPALLCLSFLRRTWRRP